MAVLYFDASGSLLRLNASDAEDALQGAPPNSAGSLAFDESTNAAILTSLAGQVAGFLWQDHKVVSGQLQRKGVALTIAADAAATADRKAVKANLAALFTALRAGTATTAQTQRVLAFLLYQYLKG